MGRMSLFLLSSLVLLPFLLLVAVSGVDIDNDDLTYVIQDQPTNGAISELDATLGKYSYTPNTDFEGTDSFTYTVNDENEFSNKATVTITVKSASTSPTNVSGTPFGSF